jgi:hypothetical protein
MSDVTQSSTIEPEVVSAPAPEPAPAAPASPPAPIAVATPEPPTVISDAPAEVGYNETVQIGTITADSGLDPLSIVFVGTPAVGTLSLDANGDVLYTAPASVTAGEIDSFTYEIEDSAGGFSAPVTNSITLDPGPIATDPNLTVGHASLLDLSAIVSKLAIPGLSGDTLTVTAASAENGTIFLNDKNGDLDYQPIANGNGGSATTIGYELNGSATGTTNTSGGPAFGNDVITYTVTDQLGDTVTGTADITVDPGPTLAAGDTFVAAGTTVNLANYIESLITPGLPRDTETITSVTAQSGSVGFVGNTAAGGFDINYTAPASGNDTLTYTVKDENGDTAVGTVTIQTDPGPVLEHGSYTIGHGQSANLTSYLQSLITPGEPGDSEAITAVQARAGTAEYVLSSGSGSGAGAGKAEIDYTAPASGNDTLTYTVTDEYGDTATGTVAITVDPGPMLEPGSVVVGHGQTVNLASTIEGLILPGLKGDTETISAISAQNSKLVVKDSEGGSTTGGATGGISIAQGNSLTVDYTAPGSGSDTVSYTVTDQLGDTATGTVAITVDPGPILTAGSYTIGHGQTANLTSLLQSLIAPGEAGDTETITSARAQNGSAQLGASIDGNGMLEQVSVAYTAPAQGTDTLTYTVTDQLGDQATGSVAITVDAGPTAGNVSADVAAGQSIDLTQQILGADTPGLAGDTLTLVADNTQGTAGSVSLVNGDLVYTASGAAFAQLGAGASATDSFTYTVSDQFGDQATGTVTLDVNNPVSAINGNPNGGSTIEGTGGNQTINAFGWSNTINANGGNDVINAGQGQATVNAGSGNVTVNLNGYNNVVTGGNGTDSVSGSLGSTSVTLGNGNDTVDLAGYGNTITVGNGNDTIVAGAGSDTVTGGSGTDNVTLAGYSDSVSFTGGNDTISGGAGSDIFDLTGGNASLALNGFSNMVFLNDTNATIADAAQGTAIDISGGGIDVIQDAASDQSLLVDLKGGLGGYASAASVVAALTSDGHGGALLSFGSSNGSLDFAGVAPSALHASNFQIG